MVYKTALPDMIVITCAFSKGHKRRTAVFFTGVKKQKHVHFLHAPIFPFF